MAFENEMDANGDDSTDDSFWRMIELTNAGRAALAQGHARQALELLREKHSLVVAKWGKDSVFSATSAVDLADACLACGNTSEADGLLGWSLDRYRALGIEDERFFRALSSWAMSAHHAAKYQDAEQRFIDLIDRYKALGSERDLERAMAMDHLAQVYLRQSRYEAAEPLLMEALVIFEHDGSDPSATAVCLSLLARMRYLNERYREAEELQRRAIASHELIDDEISLAKELDHLGATLAMRAQSEQRPDLAAEAVTHGERAVAIFEKYLPANHYSLLGAQRNLLQYKNMSETIGKMFPSGTISTTDLALVVPEEHPFTITQLLGQSWRLCQAHDYVGALELAREARSRATRNFGKQSALTSNAFVQMIGILRRNCSYLLGEPTGVLSPLEHMSMQMRAHARRGTVNDETTPAPDIESPEIAAVEQLLRRAIALAGEVIGPTSDSGDTDFSCVVRGENLTPDLLEILHYARWLGVIANDAAIRMAFEIMQLHGDGGAAQALEAVTLRTGGSAAQRAIHEDLRLAILERDNLVRLLVETKDQTAANAVAGQSTQLPALEQKILALRQRLHGEGWAPTESLKSKLTLEDAKTVLGPDEAIVAVHIGGRAVFLIAIRPEGAVFKRVEMEGELVRVMCQAVVESATLRENEKIPDFDLINALQIHDLVFLPLNSFLKIGSHLLILAGGALWTLPLGCLLVEPMDGVQNETLAATDTVHPESGEDDVDNGKFDGFPKVRQRLFRLGKWVEERSGPDALSTITARKAWVADRYRISLMPSFAPLKLRNRRANACSACKAFLGFGDPVVVSADRSDYPAVPETRRFLEGLAKALGGDPQNDVVAGNAATIDRLIDLSEAGELASRRVLCFATHSVYPRSDSDLLTDAGLLFSGGEVLTAFDIAGLRIDADFVLLTACFTGSPSGRSITVPLSGLAQAFLAAGARSLLVSHWPVEVRATEHFVRALADAIGANLPLTDALVAAEQQVRHSGSENAHPAFWAGFSIVGDGGVVIPLKAS